MLAARCHALQIDHLGDGNSTPGQRHSSNNRNRGRSGHERSTAGIHWVNLRWGGTYGAKQGTRGEAARGAGGGISDEAATACGADESVEAARGAGGGIGDKVAAAHGADEGIEATCGVGGGGDDKAVAARGAVGGGEAARGAGVGTTGEDASRGIGTARGAAGADIGGARDTARGTTVAPGAGATSAGGDGQGVVA